MHLHLVAPGTQECSLAPFIGWYPIGRRSIMKKSLAGVCHLEGRWEGMEGEDNKS